LLTAEDGVEALAMLERGEKVDLVFSDISMPNGMLGHELAARADALNRGIKVLLTSGYGYAPVNGAANEVPVLRKPYSQEELITAIRKCLEGKKPNGDGRKHAKAQGSVMPSPAHYSEAAGAAERVRH
jgi:CheY-like chemotaxis protein